MIPAAQTQPDSAARGLYKNFRSAICRLHCRRNNCQCGRLDLCGADFVYTSVSGPSKRCHALTASGASISLGFVGVGLAPQAVLAPGMIQTALNSADTSGGFALMAPQRIAVDPAGNVYLADAASNVIWRWQNRAGAIPTVIARRRHACTGPGKRRLCNQRDHGTTECSRSGRSGKSLYCGDRCQSGTQSEPTEWNHLHRRRHWECRLFRRRGAATAQPSMPPRGSRAIRPEIFSLPTRETMSFGVCMPQRNHRHGCRNWNLWILRRWWRCGATQLNHPQSVALDSTGGLFIADTGNNVIRTVDPVRQTIATIAGSGSPDSAGMAGRPQMRSCVTLRILPSMGRKFVYRR